MADLGLLAGLGAGLQQGVQGYQTERRYQDEKAKEEDDRKMKRQALALDMFKGGVNQDDSGSYSYSADEQNRRALALAKEQSETAKNTAEAGKFKGDENKANAEAYEHLHPKKKEPTQVPAAEAAAFGEGNASIGAISDLRDLVKKNGDMFGPGQSKWGSLLGAFQVGDTGRRAADIDAQLESRAAVIAKAIYGSARVTPELIKETKKLLPARSDSKQIALSKVDDLQKLASDKQQGASNALSGAGYNAGGIDLAPPSGGASGLLSKKPSDGLIASQSAPQAKSIVKTQTNARTGQKRVIYSDGTMEVQ